jgi:hypothetical protein
MSRKRLRPALAAVALIAAAAVPAQADPWAGDAAAEGAHAALLARSVGLNQHYGLGHKGAVPVASNGGGDGFDWSSASVGAALVVVAGGSALLIVRRRSPLGS